MSYKTFRIFLVLFLSFSTLQTIQAQKRANVKNPGFSITAGYAEQITSRIEDSKGFHIGANLYKDNAENLSYDAMLALNVVDGSSNVIVPLSLIGIRYYLTSNENQTRIFANALAGFAMEVKQERGDTETKPDLGYSAGIFVEGKNLLLGVSIENPEVIVLKLGVVF